MSDPILRTRNYYYDIDPGNYYITSDRTLLPKATIATKHKDVYLSDLLNNPKCSVTFGVYRDTDNPDAPKKYSGKTNDVKSGTVISYNPATNLLAVESSKNRPSRVSRLFKRTHKLRYVEPESIKVSSISRGCWLRRVPNSASRKASPKSPKGTSSPKSPKSPKRPKSPKGASRDSLRGGKRTRRRV